MSEQTVSKSVHSIPQEIIEKIENQFCRQSRIQELEHPVFPKVDKVEFIRTYQDKEGTWEVFKVNGVMLVSVLNAKYWTWNTVERDEQQKKAFGERAKYIMKKENVPWELAKMAVKMNPVNIYNSESTANAGALNFIEVVKEVLNRYRIFAEERMPIERYLKDYVHYELGYLTYKQIGIIKEYWLSQNA